MSLASEPAHSALEKMYGQVVWLALGSSEVEATAPVRVHGQGGERVVGNIIIMLSHASDHERVGRVL